MRLARLGSSTLIAALLLTARSGNAQRTVDTTAVELAATRYMIARHPAERVHLDSADIVALGKEHAAENPARCAAASHYKHGHS
jgi:hypothetical protein